MKKNLQLEKLLNEIASEAILGRLKENPRRIDREDISRLLSEHVAILLRAHPGLRDFFSGRKADRALPSSSGHDTRPTPDSSVPKSPGS